jgi:hypothetical protein
MRFSATLLLPAIALLLIPATAGAEPSKSIDLLADGLDGWEVHLVEDGVKKEDVWSIEDGVLICKGEPLGYLHTKQKFTNFKLTLQWRWAPGGEPGNSGVLLRMADKPISFLTKCAEAQLKSGSAGDLWGFYGFKMKGDPARTREIKDHDALGDFAGLGQMKAAEKKPGKWNTYDITLDGGDLTVLINGEKVNEATDCDVVAGSIGLQSEGGEIHFRKIKVTELP